MLVLYHISGRTVMYGAAMAKSYNNRGMTVETTVQQFLDAMDEDDNEIIINRFSLFNFFECETCLFVVKNCIEHRRLQSSRLSIFSA